VTEAEDKALPGGNLSAGFGAKTKLGPCRPCPSAAGQPAAEKRDDKTFTCRQEGEANLRAATEVNAVSASLTPPVVGRFNWSSSRGDLCPQGEACHDSDRRDGVSGGDTQRQNIKLTGKPCTVRRKLRVVGKRIRVEPESAEPTPGRELEVVTVPLKLGVTGPRERPYFHQANETGKGCRTAPKGKAQPRRKPAERKEPERFSQARKMQRMLYRGPSSNPEGGLRFSKIRSVGTTSYERLGNE